MKRVISIIIFVIMMLSTLTSCKNDAETTYSGSIMIYSSMDENVLMNVKKSFESKYVGITLDYYHNTIDNILNKIENDSNIYETECDVVWGGNMIDMEDLKDKGLLIPYKSKESKNVNKNYKDKKGYYISTRLAGIGFKANESFDFPKKWDNLLDAKYKNNIYMLDPNKASISKYFVCALMQNQKYGVNYFKNLKANGVKIAKSAEDAKENVLKGNDNMCLYVDYLHVYDDDDKLSFKYPNNECVFYTTPVALIKDSYNMENGKLFIDYILSEEGQTLLSNNGILPIRTDMTNDIKTNKYSKKAMKIDIVDLKKNMNNYINEFNKVFGVEQ